MLSRFSDDTSTEPNPESGLVPSGIKALDRILEGGYPENSTIMISGAPSVGKQGLGSLLSSYQG
jgi:predicted ATP-dependent serine protease